MSDSEGETVVDVKKQKPAKPVKEKKPRTEKQKQATAKALQALADAREKRWKKQEEVIEKVTTENVKPVEIPKVVEQKPEPPKVDELALIKEELKALKEKRAEPEKPKRKKKVVIVESSSSEEEEVVVKKPKKKKPEHIPEQKDIHENLIKSIFFRNI